MFLSSLDIANRACQLIGAARIASPTEDSLNNLEMAFIYDKLRRAELRRNRWVFATKRASLWPVGSGALQLVPGLWNAATVYAPGAIVSDVNNIWYISLLDQNQNNPPFGNNEAWEEYFGTRTVTLYDTTGTTLYVGGSLVYIPGSGAGTGPLAQGGYQIYLALSNVLPTMGTVAQLAPNTTTPWSATTAYYDGQTVSFGGSQWISLIAYNFNNSPVAGPASWQAASSYAIGQLVTGSNGFQYRALVNSAGFDPTVDGGTHWIATNVVTAWAPTLAVANIAWAPVFASLRNFVLVYPIGSGPSQDTTTRNVFPLPAGYLHQAPQEPKAGSVSILGAPTGRNYDDWVIENGFLVSRETGPLLFRFIADVQTVRLMDDLFCEGLAARMGMGVCERLSQSVEKFQMLVGVYRASMADARMINAIETGADEPPVDDWISTRL